MDHGVPILRPKIHSVKKKFMLELHEFDPAEMEPIGDRYIVETIPVEETVSFFSFIVVAGGTDPSTIDPRNPLANPNVERRGVVPAVIIANGNGHLLGLPDPRIALKMSGGQDVVERHPADVPMFLTPGDVCLIDFTSKGRALKIIDRDIRVINQIDVLVKLKVRVKWTEEGWAREDEETGDQAV
jgi:hypothetical protein